MWTALSMGPGMLYILPQLMVTVITTSTSTTIITVLLIISIILTFIIKESDQSSSRADKVIQLYKQRLGRREDSLLTPSPVTPSPCPVWQLVLQTMPSKDALSLALRRLSLPESLPLRTGCLLHCCPGPSSESLFSRLTHLKFIFESDS